MLLRKKPANLKDAIKDAKAVEYALAFEDAEAGLSSEPINLLHKKGNRQHEQQLQDKYLRLYQTMETLTKQVESLETSLCKVQEDPPVRSRFPQASRYNHRGRQRGRRTCHCCGQYGHFYQQCPLNYQGPAPMVDSRWSKPRNPVIYHSIQRTHSKSYSINSVLRAKGAMGNLPMEFLLDSGASVSVVRHGALNVHYQNQMNSSSTLTAVTANGGSLNILGQADLPVTIGKFKYVHTFIVADNITVDCILGADCLMRYGSVIECKEYTVRI